MTEQGFLSIPVEDLENVAEPSVVRSDEELKLVVTDVKIGTNKNNDPYALIRFAFTGVPDSKTFTKYFAIPTASMDADKKNGALRTLKYFYEAFDIDYSSGDVDISAIIGSEGWAFVGVDEQEDTDYGAQNYIKRFITPGQ